MPQQPVGLDENAPFVEKMKPALDRALALLGGTDAMRQAGEAFLPKFPAEAQETYDWRVKVATLNNFYDAMAGMMVGMILKKPVTIDKSKIPPEILADLDKRGADINALAAELAKALITKGRPHILVDHPKKPADALTAADDKSFGLRPYMVLLEPGSVINAWAATENGDERLEHFRWREYGTERDGKYQQTGVERIRVLERDPAGVKFEKWQRAHGDGRAFELKEEGELKAGGDKPMTEIPIVTLYSDRQSFMVAKPTLDDIAHKNIEHWQSSADQRHILTVSRFPIMYQLGVKNAVALVGPYSMFHTETPKTEAEIGYAEAQGFGIKEGWADMNRIVAEAEAMAVRIITSDAAKTESGEQIDYAKEGSRLQKLAVEMQRGLQQALIYMARWLGLSDADAGVVTVFKDFGLSGDDAKAIENLLKLREVGDLSRPTLWAELAERGFFKSPFNPKKEQDLIDDEDQQKLDRQLAIGAVMTPPEDDPPEDEEDDDADPPAAKKKAAA